MALFETFEEECCAALPATLPSRELRRHDRQPHLCSRAQGAFAAFTASAQLEWQPLWGGRRDLQQRPVDGAVRKGLAEGSP